MFITSTSPLHNCIPPPSPRTTPFCLSLWSLKIQIYLNMDWGNVFANLIKASHKRYLLTIANRMFAASGTWQSPQDIHFADDTIQQQLLPVAKTLAPVIMHKLHLKLNRKWAHLTMLQRCKNDTNSKCYPNVSWYNFLLSVQSNHELIFWSCYEYNSKILLFPF